MAISATPSSSPRPPSSLPSVKQPPPVKQFPAKLRRQSTFERQSQPPPNLPQPTTPTLLSLSRNNSRSRSTPPQHTLSTSASFGESIFQSLSFGPFTSTSSKPTSSNMPRSPPSRSSTTLANVLESPTRFETHSETGSETPRPPLYASGHSHAPSRRRVTSPDTAHPFDSAQAGSPNSHAPSGVHMGGSSPRSPPLTFGDPHPRKARSTLRLSRLRPGLGKEEMAQLDGETTPDAAHSTRESHSRPSSRGNTASDKAMQRTISVRRPGSAGEIARRSSLHHGVGKEGDMAGERDGVGRGGGSSGMNGKGRGMRVRASSELTRPAIPLSTIRHAANEPCHPPRPTDSRPRHAELRPPLPLSSAGASTLAPVPVSPGVQSTWSKHSGESALADDSDVDADVPATPSLTTGTSHAGSRSNSNAKDATSLDPRSQGLSSTPKPFAPILDSDVLDRTRAREDADRRRRGETARELEERQRHSKYFKLKGPSKERCHAFPVEEVPYPVSYTPRVLDNYTLDDDLFRQGIPGVTFHSFKAPPAKVLDLGCGTGYWILRAAREWTETEFVGFDLVPIQPNLERVMGKSGVSMNGNSHGDLRLHERIRWVHGNFLEKLPFEDAEFDMVRCRRIARGVPESKWDGLYEEIVRVMKPGAAFEHIEDDILFPSEISNKSNPPAVAVYPTPSSSRALPTPPYLSSASLPPGASPVRPPDQYRRSPSTSFSSVLDSPVEGRNTVPSVPSTGSPSLAGSTEPPASRFSVSPANPRATLVVPGPVAATPLPGADAYTRDSRGSGDSSEHASRPAQATDYSFCDPRVHTRLNELYVSMHEARWINLKPLSIIPRLIQEHMGETMSSPPLNQYLPPRPRDSPPLSRVVGVIEIARASGEALSKQLASIRAAETGQPIDENIFIPQPGDEEVSRYMKFDLTRVGAVSRNGGLMSVGNWTFDLGWLPMHLSIGVAEVLACKEAMWEHLKEQEPTFDRREYDAMIRQYKTDMQDRIGLSPALREKMQWGPPESDFMRTPDQRVFEEHYAQALARDRADPASANRPPGLMRCSRAFVARKQTE